MRRRLPAILAACSLAACLAVLWLWQRSLMFGDFLEYHWPTRAGGTVIVDAVWSHGGAILLGRCHADPVPGVPGTPVPGGVGRPRTPTWVHPLFFEAAAVRVPSGSNFGGGTSQTSAGAPPGVAPNRLHSAVVCAPHWFVAALLALFPALWLRRRLRPPAPAGRCPACGYDLRATPDRCPECGATPATGAAHAEPFGERRPGPPRADN